MGKMDNKDIMRILSSVVTNYSSYDKFSKPNSISASDDSNYILYAILADVKSKRQFWEGVKDHLKFNGIDLTSVNLDMDELRAHLPDNVLSVQDANFYKGHVQNLLANLGLSPRAVDFIINMAQEMLKQKSPQVQIEQAFTLNTPKEIAKTLEQTIDPLADMENQLRGEPTRSFLMTIVVGRIIVQGINSIKINAGDDDRIDDLLGFANEGDFTASYKGVSP